MKPLRSNQGPEVKKKNPSWLHLNSWIHLGTKAAWPFEFLCNMRKTFPFSLKPIWMAFTPFAMARVLPITIPSSEWLMCVLLELSFFFFSSPQGSLPWKARFLHIPAGPSTQFAIPRGYNSSLIYMHVLCWSIVTSPFSISWEGRVCWQSVAERQYNRQITKWKNHQWLKIK